MSTLVAELTAVGELMEMPGLFSPPGSSGGRPATRIALSRRAGIVLGIDVGQRHVRAALVGPDHTILIEGELALVAGLPQDQVLTKTAGVIEDVLREARVDLGELVSVGMGVPWLVGTAHPPAPTTADALHDFGTRGTVARAPTVVMQALGLPEQLPVSIDNDANLGALGEWTWGAAEGFTDVVYVKVATGVGAGLILDGRLHRGVGGSAGEIGHVTTDPLGPRCVCGKRGCLEAMIGGPALLANVYGNDREQTIDDLVTAARDGHQLARRVLAEAGHHLGATLASVCDLLNPALVVIGGELADADTLLLAPVRTSLHAAAAARSLGVAHVATGQLGARAPLMGAIAVALENACAHTAG
ncbi:ROK family protein [Modestobacter sp. SSW1-42]|uniref:ROK family protein n=1 Tax=Modestobacter sp. SSW1-42 TaxID=596372 RepID=UPI0039861ADF